MTGLLSGVLLAMLGGMLNGSFTAPMKFTRSWAWENTWLVYSLVGLLFLPFFIALLSVPDLLGVYQSADRRAVALAIIFGFGWGIGSVLFGLGISILGMALGFAIILGLTAALGSLIPLLVLSPESLFTTRGVSVLVGLAIVIVGIVLCAKAGGMKSASESALTENEAQGQRSPYRLGLLICIGSGIFNSMLNLALAFGAPVAETAVRSGATTAASQNAIWALAVSAGAVANVAYTLLLLFKNRSWRRFGEAKGVGGVLLAAVMGVLWMGGISVYGSGAVALGDMGAIMGWPLFMSMVIITGNIWGHVTGEWRQAPRSAMRLNLAGVAVLIIAIAVISIGGSA